MLTALPHYVWQIPPFGAVRLSEDLIVLETPPRVTVKAARIFGDRPFLLIGLPNGREVRTGPNDVRVQSVMLSAAAPFSDYVRSRASC